MTVSWTIADAMSDRNACNKRQAENTMNYYSWKYRQTFLFSVLSAFVFIIIEYYSFCVYFFSFVFWSKIHTEREKTVRTRTHILAIAHTHMQRVALDMDRRVDKWFI